MNRRTFVNQASVLGLGTALIGCNTDQTKKNA